MHFRRQDAAGGAAPGPRDGAERRALPVAHDQRRGGLGLLRGRHRAGAHRRRHRLRARSSTSRRPATSASWSATGSTSSSRRPGCGPTSGFWRSNGSDPAFHIHGVTGPDEYTTVVNNNLFTNVMARYNLEQTVAALARIRDEEPTAYEQVVARLALEDDEVEEWARCADGHAHPVRRGPRHPPAGRLLPRPRGVGPVEDAGRAPAAAAALPPAGDLPLPGAQAGRRGARAVPAGRPVHRRGEARRLRVLRPDHHRRLDALGGRAVDHGGGGRLPRRRVGLLPARPLRRPDEPAREHRRRPAHRLGRRRVGRSGLRLRRHARHRRPAVVRPTAARRLERDQLPALLARRAAPGDRVRRRPGGRVGGRRARRRDHRARGQAPHRGRRHAARRARRARRADRRHARRRTADRRDPRRRQHDHAGVPDPIPFEDHQELAPADVPLVDPPVPSH